ncbi:NAD-dependent epimerase/dehydratase [Fulvivirgaceae bacterium BMA10]|uniref:NAD-dependent epimerase/dehydratase n=1 Tax=Splendidivirga corallicola TaxID=3051826 RepID=A0ABT8KRZ2_9BACT|nr:NAD-dependent epimerase/dehydratase [Fulvivirgaceae bacterium BMA10]
MKVLVTGGAGYIGTELVKLLVKNEDVESVTVFDNQSRINYNFFLGHRRDNHAKIRFINGDILDSRKLKKELDGVDVVYHLAANVTTPFANMDAHFFEQVNHWGTAEMTYAIEQSQIKKVIYTSSVSVYGGSSKKIVDEETNLNPRTFYGISKMRGEEHISRLSDNISTYILRCGNVYGYSKSMRFDAVINKFAFEANFNKRISIHGNGKQNRAFIHIDLLSKALADLLTTEVPSGIYNIIERNMEVLEIVDTFKMLIPELEFIFVNQHLSLRDIKINPDLKLKKYLNIDNNKRFEEEIEEFLNHFSF